MSATEKLGAQFGPTLSHSEYAARAADPQPGTQVFRSETRVKGTDMQTVADTGRHWTTKPLDYGWGEGTTGPRGTHDRVVWHGVIDDPAAQVQPQTEYRAFEPDEVRMRPGARVRLVGHSTTTDPQRGDVRVRSDGAPEHPAAARELEIRVRRGRASP